VAVSVVRRSRTFERREDGGDADLPRHAARPEGGLGLHADVRRLAAVLLRRHPLRPRVWLGLVALLAWERFVIRADGKMACGVRWA
jgi:hypothetical protein